MTFTKITITQNLNTVSWKLDVRSLTNRTDFTPSVRGDSDVIAWSFTLLHSTCVLLNSHLDFLLLNEIHFCQIWLFASLLDASVDTTLFLYFTKDSNLWTVTDHELDELILKISAGPPFIFYLKSSALELVSQKVWVKKDKAVLVTYVTTDRWRRISMSISSCEFGWAEIQMMCAKIAPCAKHISVSLVLQRHFQWINFYFL